MKSAPPTEAFWTLYRRYKETLKNSGIQVSQFNNEWSVNWWQRNGKFEYPVLPQAPVANHKELDIHPLVNESGLLAYQKPLVSHLVAVMKAENALINGSGTGVGKTFITLGVGRERAKKLLVICPKTIVPDWKRAADYMKTELAGVYGWEWLKTGKTEFGKWEMITHGPSGRKLPRAKKGRFIWTVPDGVEIVFDEAHRGSGNGTQNSEVVRSAAEAKIPIHALSATLANDPTRLFALGYVLRLHDGTQEGFRDFMIRFGCKEIEISVDKGGKRTYRKDDDEDDNDSGFRRKIKVWKFIGTDRDLKSLHSHIFPHKGIRVTPEELGDAFPETQIVAKAYEIDEARDITNAYEEMQNKIAEIEDMEELNNSEKSANILAEMMRARKRVEFLKINLVVSLTRDYLEEGHSVFLAVNFRDTLFGQTDEWGNKVAPGLVDLLKIKSLIVGSQKDIDRRNAIDDFQSDRNRVCAGIIQACREGLSLHDLNGKHPRVALIMPCQAPVDLKQVLGRVHRANGKTKSIQRILFAANTIEEAVCKNLATKLDRLDLLMDGDLNDGIFPNQYSSMRAVEEAMQQSLL